MCTGFLLYLWPPGFWVWLLKHHRSPTPPQRGESPQTHDGCCVHSESPLCLVGPKAVPHVSPLKPPFPPWTCRCPVGCRQDSDFGCLPTSVPWG